MDQVRPIPDTEYEAAILVHIIKKADFSRFLHASGNDAVRLNKVIGSFLERKLINYVNDELRITEIGCEYYREYMRMLGRRGLYKFFLPDYSVRKNKWKKEDIYIPNLKERSAPFRYL